MNPEMRKVKDVRDANGSEKQIWGLGWVQEPMWKNKLKKLMEMQA